MTVRLSGSYGTWSLPDGEIILGRGKTCPLHIPDPRLSRNHARFVVAGARATVDDLKSTNGVIVNGRLITGPTVLGNGDLISIGPCLLLVAINSEQPNPKDLEIFAPERPVTFTNNSEEGPFDDWLNSPTVPAPPPGNRPVRTVATDRNARQSATDTLKPGEYTPPGTAAVTPGSAAAATADRTAAAESGTDRLKPSDSHASSQTALASSAMRAGELLDNPERRSGGLAPSDIASGSVDALQLHSEARRRLGSLSASGLNARVRRVQAGLLDAAQAMVLSLVIAAPIAIGGYGIALRRAGATLYDGLPAVMAHGEAASAWNLGQSLLRPGGLNRAWELINRLHQQADQGPFLWLFAAVTLSILVFVLVHLLATVAATVLHGAPYWHRRLGLVIAVRNQPQNLDWTRAFVRWLLFAALFPLALLAVWTGRRGLHDVAAGSEVRLKRGSVSDRP